MSSECDFTVHLVSQKDVALMEGLLSMFGEAFDEVETYNGARPSKTYLQRLLRSESFIALAALANGVVVGGIAAYELKKYEQERSEIYLYDLAVSLDHRRKGIATKLILELKSIAAERGCYVIFVQADLADRPAQALYSKFGRREDVLHFDIDVSNSKDSEHQ